MLNPLGSLGSDTDGRTCVSMWLLPSSSRHSVQERHLVAAIQFEEPEEEEVDLTASAGFETFKANERQTSAGE